MTPSTNSTLSHRKSGSKARLIASITSTTSSHFENTMNLHPKQAEILSVLSSGLEFSLTQLSGETTRLRHGHGIEIIRYHTGRLEEFGYITIIGPPLRRMCAITAEGAAAFKAYHRESYVMPAVAPSSKIDKLAGVYVPPKAYYRNDGHVGLPSRGYAC